MSLIYFTLKDFGLVVERRFC